MSEGDDKNDLLIGHLALERGLITAQQFDAALAERTRAAARGESLPVTAVLLAQGVLSTETLAGLQTEDGRSGPSADPTLVSGGALRRALPIRQLGRYALVREIGRGGMGVVHEAHDTQLDRRVALKLMLMNSRASPEELRVEEERFVREARVCARLQHPGIVTVYDAGLVDGTLYLAMQLVEGKPLSTLRRDGNLDLRQQVQMLRDVALAVHYAHEQGVLHRDLKPGNVLVDAQRHPFVTDFGLAKSAGQDAGASLTTSGQIVGTPRYMSPEQAQALKAIDRRTDVYSLGAMLYEILTGRPPFEGESALEVLVRVVRDPVERPTSVLTPKSSRAVDATIEAVCLKALSKLPEDRHATAQGFADDLSAWLAGEPVGSLLPASKKPRRQVLVATAFAFVAVAIVLVILFQNGAKDAPPTTAPSPEGSRVEAVPPREDEWSKAVDLLPLVDTPKDAVAGTWNWREDQLVVAAAPFARLELPYRPPEEYDLRVTFTPAEVQGGVILLLSSAGRPFTWVMGGWQNEIFGFGRVGGLDARSNATTVRRKPCLEPRRSHTALLKVRKGHLSASLDGKPVAEWNGNAGDLSTDEAWRLRDDALLGLASHLGACGFSRVQLLPRAGSGRPTRTPSLPPGPDVGPVPDEAWRRAHDMLRFAQPGLDALEGTWTATGSSIHSDTSRHARMELVLQPPEEYDMRVEFSRTGGNGDVVLMLSQEGRCFTWQVGGHNNTMSGFHLIAGKDVHENPTGARRAAWLENGRRHTALVQVRKNGIRALFDGEVISQWRTDFSDVGIFDAWGLREPRRIGIGSFLSPVAFHRVEILEVSGRGVWSRIPPGPACEPPADDAWARSRSLLALVDPARDTVTGRWTLADGKLVSDASSFAKIELPYRPPEEYDVRVVFTRREGRDPMGVTLSKSGRPVAWTLGGWRNTLYNFEILGAHTVGSNPTHVRSEACIDVGRRYSTVVQVRKDGLKAWLDGKLITQWRTDGADLGVGPQWRLRDSGLLGVGTDRSPTDFERIDLIEVTGKGAPAR